MDEIPLCDHSNESHQMFSPVIVTILTSDANSYARHEVFCNSVLSFKSGGTIYDMLHRKISSVKSKTMPEGE